MENKQTSLSDRMIAEIKTSPTMIEAIENYKKEREQKPYRRIPRWILEQLVVQPHKMYGTAAPSQEVQKAAKSCSEINTIANWIDFALNLNIFILLVSGVGGLFSPLLGIVISILILRFSSTLAEAISGAGDVEDE